MQANLTKLTIDDFLLSRTPDAWLQKAVKNLPLLLIDHAHCERKAALSAISLMNGYPQHADLLLALSQLAREELLHFEKVLQLLNHRRIPFHHLHACAYAKTLFEAVRKEEPGRLVDKLIIGAVIEARSSERFTALLPYLDKTLSQFYETLVKSETRHFLSYLAFADKVSQEDITDRIDLFLSLDKTLIESEEALFRFHSGV